MLEINIDDTTDMNKVREMVRKYYLEHNIVSNNKPKQTKTKPKTKPLPIEDNKTNSLDKEYIEIEGFTDKEYIEIDGFTYCHLDCIGYKGYYICREDAGVYREIKGELKPLKSTLWMPPSERKSPA